MKNTKTLLLVQGLYILITAVWPLVHIESFMAVTGYKTDQWLVKTLSLVLLPIAFCYFYTLVTKQNNGIIAVLGISHSLALLCADVYYPLKGTISMIYMADGVFQLIFIVWWIYTLLRIQKAMPDKIE